MFNGGTANGTLSSRPRYRSFDMEPLSVSQSIRAKPVGQRYQDTNLVLDVQDRRGILKGKETKQKVSTTRESTLIKESPELSLGLEAIPPTPNGQVLGVQSTFPELAMTNWSS